MTAVEYKEFLIMQLICISSINVESRLEMQTHVTVADESSFSAGICTFKASLQP
jgi:hypothetical protein